MKRNLIFIRHGKLDLPYASHDVMPIAVLNDLATKKLDPASDHDFFKANIAYFKSLIKKFNITTVYCSPSQRCVSLENLLQPFLHNRMIPVFFLNELNEIYFDLNVLFASVNKITLSEVNYRLFDALLNNDDGVEPIGDVLKRIDFIFQKMPNSENILILTHGFLMRVIAAHHQYCVAEAKERFILNDILAIPRFNYFNGFIIDSNDKIKFISPG